MSRNSRTWWVYGLLDFSGASDGFENRRAKTTVCKTVLRICCAQQSPKNLQIDRIHVTLGGFFFGRLEDHGVTAKAGVVDEQTKRLQAEASSADVGVAVDAAVERLL